MKLVYVAGKFRSMNRNGKSNAWGVQCNIMAAMEVALEVWKAGHVALCPHANTMFFQDADGCDDSVWLDGDIILLSKCDAMVMVPGWEESSGARKEREYALQHNIPVYLSVKEFLDSL